VFCTYPELFKMHTLWHIMHTLCTSSYYKMHTYVVGNKVNIKMKYIKTIDVFTTWRLSVFSAGYLCIRQARFSALRTQRKAKNTPRKRNRTCSDWMQATQEVANDMVRICHVIRCLRYVCCVKPRVSCVFCVACVRLEIGL